MFRAGAYNAAIYGLFTKWVGSLIFLRKSKKKVESFFFLSKNCYIFVSLMQKTLKLYYYETKKSIWFTSCDDAVRRGLY